MSKSNINIDLIYENPFILHAFLDEYIGSGKGNTARSTIEDFLRHLPEPFQTNFRVASTSYDDFQSLLKEIKSAECVVDLVPETRSSSQSSYSRYGRGDDPFDKRYNNDTERIDSVQSYSYVTNIVGGKGAVGTPVQSGSHVNKTKKRVFLKQLWDTNKHFNKFPSDFSEEYRGLEYHIDPKTEQIVSDKVSDIVKDVVNRSKQQPVFLPIGYPGHLVGLVLTEQHVILTNSGAGLEYHDTYNPEGLKKNLVDLKIKPKPVIKTSSDTVLDTSSKSSSKNTVTTASVFEPGKKAVTNISNTPTSMFKMPGTSTTTINKKPITTISEKPVSVFNIGVRPKSDEEIGASGLNVTLPSVFGPVNDAEIDSSLPPHPQCILHVNRPDDYILEKIVTELVQLSENYTNVDVHHVYAVYYKLYILHLIKEMGVEDEVCNIVKSTVVDMINDHGMMDDFVLYRGKDSIKTQIFGESRVMKSAWIHPEYHESVVYGLDITNIDIRKCLEPIRTLLSDSTFKEFASQFRDVTISNITSKLIETVMAVHSVYIITLNLSGDGFNPIRYALASDISTVLTTGIINSSKEYETEFRQKNEGVILYDILNRIKLHGDDIDEKLKEIVPKNYDSLDYEQRKVIDKNIKDTPEFKLIVEKAAKKQVDSIAKLSQQQIIELKDALRSALSEEIITEIDDAVAKKQPYNLIKRFSDVCENITSRLKELGSNYDLAKLTYHPTDSHKNATLLEAFCDIVIHKAQVQNSTIYVDKSHSGLTSSYLSALDVDLQDTQQDKRYTPYVLTVQKTSKILPNLFKLINQKRVHSAIRHGFYVREQFAGSCTFNGTILAVSLMGDADFTRSPDLPLKLYASQYAKLKTAIRLSILKNIKENIHRYKSNTINEKNRATLEMMMLVCERDGLVDPETGDEGSKIFGDILGLLPPKKLGQPKIKFVKGGSDTKTTSDDSILAGVYSTLEIKLHDTPEVIVKKLASIQDMFRPKSATLYIDHVFLRSIVQPFVLWCKEFASTKPTVLQVDNTFTPIVDALMELIEIEKKKFKEDTYAPRDSMGLYLMTLYILFKMIDMKEIFDNEYLDVLRTDYNRDTPYVARLLSGIYLTTLIDHIVVKELCDIIEKYQCLIIPAERDLNIVHLSQLMEISSAQHNQGHREETSDHLDILRFFEIFSGVPEMRHVYTLLENGTFGDQRSTDIKKLITTKGFTPMMKKIMNDQQTVADSIKGHENDEPQMGFSYGAKKISTPVVTLKPTRTIEKSHINAFIDNYGNSTHICVFYKKSDNTKISRSDTVLCDINRERTLILPLEGYFFIKIDDIGSYGRFTLDLKFSFNVDSITVYQFTVNKDSSIFDYFTNSVKEISVPVKSFSRYNPQDIRKFVLDPILLKQLMLMGDYKELTSYVESISVGKFDINKNKWSYPYRMNFLLPLFPTVPEDKLLTHNITDTNTFYGSSIYNFYNSHIMIRFYEQSIRDILDTLKNSSLPKEPNSILQRLRVFTGELFDFIEQKEERSISGQQSKLTIEFATHDKNKNVVEMSSGTSDSDNNVIFQIGTGGYNRDSMSSKYLKYSVDDDHIYIDKCRLLNADDIDQIDHLVDQFKHENRHDAVQFIKNVAYYAENIPEFLIGFDKSYKNAVIMFPRKSREYYVQKMYDHPWTEASLRKDPDMNIHYDLHTMNDSALQLMWVKFDIDYMHGALPILDHEINNGTDTYMMSFTLFYEYLLLNEKFNLVNLLLPQLVSSYFTRGKNQSGRNHTHLIDKIIKEQYVPSPYRHYILNRLSVLINGTYNNNDVYEYLKRADYYTPTYQKDVDVIDLLQDAKQSVVELQYYKRWVSTYQSLLKKKGADKMTLLQEVRKILEFMKRDGVNERFIDVKDLETYTTPLHYLVKNMGTMFNNLQLNILNRIRSTLEQIVDENEITGNIKYFVNETFDHTLTDETACIVKLFELVTGKILDQIQYDFVVNMINDDDKRIYHAYELLMGRGKTFVIIPCLAFFSILKGSYFNVINCLPSHLVNQSMKIMNRLSPFIANGFIVRAEADRGEKNIEHIRTLLEKECRKIIVINDISLKSYLLTSAELKSGRSKLESTKLQNQTGGVYFDIHLANFLVDDSTREFFAKQNKLMYERLKKINATQDSKEYDHLRDNSLIIVDEFDSVVDSLKSDLNYPFGDLKNLDLQIILNKLVVCITESLFEKYTRYMMYSDRADKSLNKMMIREVFSSIDKTRFKEIYDVYDEIVSKISSSYDEIPEQFSRLSSSELQQLQTRSQQGGKRNTKQTGGSRESLLMYFIKEVYSTFIACLEMMLDKDYGWDDLNIENPYIVVPYSAQKTPMQGSKFSSPIINTILTAIAYYSKQFRRVDVLKLMEYIRFLVNSSSKDYVVAEKELDEIGVSSALMKDDMMLCDHLERLKIQDRVLYNNYLRLYLVEIIFPKFIMVDPNIYNCSFIDVIDPDFIKAKFALSGTVNVHLPEFKYYGEENKISTIKYDEITTTKIEKVLIGDNLLKEPTQTILLNDLKRPTDIRGNSSVPANVARIINHIDDGNYAVLMSILKLLNDPKSPNGDPVYNVLIDVGSFLRNYENFEVATILSYICPDTNIVFFDENDQPIAMLNGEIVNFDLKTLKRDINTKIYFDQKHTVGTDLDLHSSSSALLTVNSTTARSALVQGAYRLREADIRQKITYLVKDIDPKTKAVVTNINRKERTNFEKSKYKFYQQTVLTLLRRYDQYSKESYQFRTFVPNLSLSDTILNKGGYTYDYKKEDFIEYVMKKLDESDQYAKENSELRRDHLRANIKEELLGYLDLIKHYTGQDDSVTVQKQTNVNVEMNYQTELERNHNKTNFDVSSAEFKKIPEFGDVIDNNELINVKFSEQIESEEMMKYIKSLNIRLTPMSALAINNLYNDGELKISMFMLMDPKAKDTYVTLMTSFDIVSTSTTKMGDDVRKRIVKLDKFVSGDNDEAFYKNMLMFLLLKIPSLKSLNEIKKSERINELIPILRSHYSNASKYKLATVSKPFAEFLNMDQ